MHVCLYIYSIVVNMKLFTYFDYVVFNRVMQLDIPIEYVIYFKIKTVIKVVTTKRKIGKSVMHILAKGKSMLPTLKEGENYKLALLENQDVDVGDIIVYCVENLVICHRVINIIRSKNNTVFLKTKGDNCTEPDPYAVTLDMVIGKVIV